MFAACRQESCLCRSALQRQVLLELKGSWLSNGGRFIRFGGVMSVIEADIAWRVTRGQRHRKRNLICKLWLRRKWDVHRSPPIINLSQMMNFHHTFPSNLRWRFATSFRVHWCVSCDSAIVILRIYIYENQEADFFSRVLTMAAFQRLLFFFSGKSAEYWSRSKSFPTGEEKLGFWWI